MGRCHITRGSGAPSVAPFASGDHYIDTSTGDHYLSNGNSSVSDWELVVLSMPQATETVQGIAEIATQAEVDAGTDDQRFVTPLKLDVKLSAEITQAVNDVVDAAPGALDTLNELAAALGDDPNFATTVNNSLALKLNTADFEATHDALPSDNPHGVTAAQVGLGNVDNTSDADKPVSTAQQAALDLKYDASNPDGFETPSQLNVRDTNNRNRANHTGTQLSSTISDFATTVRSTVLTGLSLASTAAVVATDSILVAIGKLQAQLDAKVFGTQAEDFIDTGNVSYTTNTLFEAYSFTTQSNPSGRYRVGLTVHYEPGSSSSNDLLQLRINGTQIGLEFEDEGKDTGSDIRRTKYLFGYYQHTGPATFDIELWAAQDGGGTSVLHGVQAESWRVS